MAHNGVIGVYAHYALGGSFLLNVPFTTAIAMLPCRTASSLSVVLRSPADFDPAVCHAYHSHQAPPYADWNTLLCCCVLCWQVSSSSGQNIKAVFASLFARMLATIPGIPQDLAALAVQQANAAREEGA